MRSIRTLAKLAYKNRYSFARVTISRDGAMHGHWADTRQKFDPVKLGNIADCRTADNGRKTGVRFYNRDALIYTFGPEG